MTDATDLRALVRRAALVGAAEVRGAQAAHRPATGKGLPGDWVTEVDVRSELAIEAFLAREGPAIDFHGEETGGVAEGLRWVVDPLDGTTNFVHRFPAVGVSVALVDGDEVVAGAIAAPFLGDVWHAIAGEGALWEHPDGSAEPCHVGSRAPSRAVVATGFPFRRRDVLPRYLRAMTSALERFEDLRRPGAACLDLAWVACGVFDGFFELGLSVWDVAAGGLLVREAGGTVSDWAGRPGFLSGDILAGPAPIHRELVTIAGAA